MIKNWKLEITENETKLIIQDGAAMNNDILSLARHLVIKYHLNKLPVYHENGNKYFTNLAGDIEICFIWIPIVLCVLIAVLTYFYKLDSIRGEMTEELEKRR